MADPLVAYQTLSEFMEAPFGKKNLKRDSDYEAKYQSFKNSNKIRVEGYTKHDDDCFIHIKVPSESNKDTTYDVIVQFFTEDEKIKKEVSYKNYFVKFFSNSPSFIYRYAVLYKQNGYLIDSLFEKMDSKFQDKLPEKTNSSMEMTYDKSIYFACRYLSDDKFGVLNKFGILLRKNKNFNRFIQDISSFEDIKSQADIRAMEKKAKEDTDKEKKKAEGFRKKVVPDLFRKEKKDATKSTVQSGESGIHKVAKKTGKSSTMHSSKKKKIGPKRTTRQ